jgi:type IV secretory pathway VirB10-like protein
LLKNDEAGIRQNQLSHKPQEDQAVLQNQSVLSTEKQRQRSNRIDENSTVDIRDSNNEKEQKQGKGNKKQFSQEGKKPGSRTDHPYKGHHIDLSL